MLTYKANMISYKNKGKTNLTMKKNLYKLKFMNLPKMLRNGNVLKNNI